MKTWRLAVLALSFLLLGGCLVTFKDPLPAHEAAPDELRAIGPARMPGANRSIYKSAASVSTAIKR